MKASPLNIVVLLIVLSLKVFTQSLSCEIGLPNSITICEAETVEISVSGNFSKVQWFDDEFIKLDTGQTFSRLVKQSAKFYAINRKEIGSNLLSNGDFEQGDTGFDTDYFNMCKFPAQTQGGYCVSPTTNQFHPGWTSCSDHTSGNGNLFLSDGATDETMKIWCNTVSVEQNETYAFSIWASPLINENLPDLKLTVNGTSIGETFNIDENPCEWSEFFRVWESELNTSAEICIFNENSEGGGNDFILDDLSFKKVCLDTAEVDVVVQNNLKVNLGKNYSICPGDERQLSNSASTISNANYEWNTFETGEQITIDYPGQYWLKATTPEDCWVADTINIGEVGIPKLKLSPDTVVCFNAVDSLLLNPGNANLVVWRNSVREVIDTTDILEISKGGVYNVDLINGENCRVSGQIIVDTLCAEDIFFPNAFSPDGNGVNDVFKAYAIETYNFELIIFNKWGEVVYQSKDLNEGWDGNLSNGQQAPTGVYVYRCEYELIDNVSKELTEDFHIGHLTLLR